MFILKASKSRFFLFWAPSHRIPLQTQDEVIVQTPEITQQVHHATDEEKLASTGMIGQTGDSQDQEDVEPKANPPAPGKKQPIKSTSDMKGLLGSCNSAPPCAGGFWRRN